MKKLTLALLVLTVVASLGFSQAKYKVGVSMPSATHGWMANANWWAQRAKSDWEGRDKSVTIELKFFWHCKSAGIRHRRPSGKES
ncbi:hypothetical protein MASR2M78_18450 [Treponema sp.]